MEQELTPGQGTAPHKKVGDDIPVTNLSNLLVDTQLVSERARI